jgi:glycosyltransferase involved in cell wall biosynthesis
LVVGRAKKIPLKGLDIAAKALGSLPGALRSKLDPVLWVRGAPLDEGDETHEELRSCSGLPRSAIKVREYSVNADVVRKDLMRATVLLMPSRVEGFGLVGLEAIAVGTPVLVSSESGLALLLGEHLGQAAEDFIVPIADDDSKDVAAWRDALAQVLADPNSAFERAHSLRESLAPVLTWERTVELLLHECSRDLPPA